MTHVLLVEDDVDTRALVRELLIRRGHEVDACATALDALRLFRERPYPLVVTDWLMPGIDGLQLTREIRKLDGGEWCVVVVVTARQEVGDLQTVLDAGADDYVTKPFEISYLNVRLEVAERRVAETSRRRAAESAAEASRSSLERSRNDLLAILDLMRVAIAMVDAAGAVTFLSKAAETLLGVDRRSGSGSFWSDVLPLPESVVARVQEVAALPESERPRLEAAIVRRGLALQLEIEVRDDPRGLASRILFLYDVTERNELQQMLRDRQRLGQIIAKSRPMLEVFRLIGELAKVDTTVLILGETGTGKELAARAIHEASDRCEKPFVAVNCAGLTESLLGSQLFGHRRGAFTGAISDQQGMFEAAEGGTIFLDEIGDVPHTVQLNLLRVLQEREVTRIGDTRPRKVDVRIIAATNADIRQKVDDGLFRHDLYYRIRVATVSLPPLRERRDDIPLLAAAFLARYRVALDRAVRRISNRALRALVEHDWPGNVRELQAVIEFAVIRAVGDEIGLEDLPSELSPQAASPSRNAGPPSLAPADAYDERAEIVATLQRCRGNRAKAARELGMSRATFYRRLTEFGIEPKRLRRSE